MTRPCAVRLRRARGSPLLASEVSQSLPRQRLHTYIIIYSISLHPSGCAVWVRARRSLFVDRTRDQIPESRNQNKSDARRHRGRRTRRQSDARQRGKRPCRCSVQDAMTRQPECKWAQRPDRILFTVNVPNVEVEKADIRV